MAIRYPREGNPHYPLPSNYYELGQVEQRAARLNAVMLQETPEDLAIAWAFFREYYLKPKEVGWYKRYKESPPLHYKMVQDLGQYPYSAWAAPRGFSKTTVMRELCALLTLTRPNFVVALVQATDRKARKSMSRLKRLFEKNPRIIEDFGVQRAKRGERFWNTEMLELPNGSSIEALSVRGALRGDRPDLLLIDDPEYDEDESTDQTLLLEDFEILLFKTLMPMLEEGTALFWIGTMISRRSFLWTIVEGEDSRFQFWNRRNIPIKSRDGVFAWESKWNDVRIEELRALLGEAAFNSEYMNQPGSGAERLLKIHPQLCTYTVEGAPQSEAEPLKSRVPLVFQQGLKEAGRMNYIVERREFGPWAQGLYRMICVDHARKTTITADESCVLVMGFDQEDTLWVLDIFLGRVRREQLTRIVFDMAMKWGVRVIGSEAISVEEETTNQMTAMLSQMGSGVGWIPKVIPIKYAKREVRDRLSPNQTSKSDRISGLEWRHNQFRIRYPIHRKGEYAVSQLLFQVENFTMDLSLLRHDDAVDTLAMHQHVVRRKGGTSRTHEVPNLKRASDYLRDGVLADAQTGIPYFGALGAQIPLDVVNELMAKRYRDLNVGQEEIDLGSPAMKAWLQGESPWQSWSESLALS